MIDMQNRKPRQRPVGRANGNGKGDKNAETAIGSRVVVQPNGCWLFKGRVDKYGVTSVYRGHGPERISVHRFVYETLVGPIPDDHHLHHKCETPGCCNPAHLKPLTPKEHGEAHVELRHSRSVAR